MMNSHVIDLILGSICNDSKNQLTDMRRNHTRLISAMTTVLPVAVWGGAVAIRSRYNLTGSDVTAQQWREEGNSGSVAKKQTQSGLIFIP